MKIATLLALISLFISSVVSSTEKDKTEILIEELNLILKAAERFSSDTGEILSITSDTDISYGYLKIDDLIIDPGIPNWKGPYLNYKNDSSDKAQYIDHPEYKDIYLLSKENVEWNRGSKPTGCKQSSSSCSIASCIWGVPRKIVRQIDMNIDKISDNAKFSGRVRYDDGIFSGIVCLIGDSYPRELSPVK